MVLLTYFKYAIFIALIAKTLLCAGQVASSPLVENLDEKIDYLRKKCNLNPDSTLVELEELLLLTDSLQLKNEKAELIRLKGLANFYKGNFSYAHDLFSQSQELFKTLGNIDGEADALNNIAVIHGKLGNVKQSFEMNLEILEMRKKSGNLKKLAWGYNNLAVSYRDIKEYEKALEFYKKSLTIHLNPGDYSSIDLTYNNIGNIYQLIGQADSSLYYFNKSLEYSIPQNNKQMMANSYVYIGDYYWNKNLFKMALGYYQKGLNLALETGIVYEIEWAAEALQKAQAQLGDYENAYKSLQLQKQMDDSTKIIEIIQKITQIEAEIEFEIERELNRITAEKAQLENMLEISRQKQARNIAILLFISFFIISLSIFRNFLLKKRDNTLLKMQKDEISIQNDEILQQRNKIEEMNKAKDKFFAIIAHDLKNPLGGMQNLSETIYNNISFISPEKMQTYLGSLKDSSKQVYALLENLLHWAALQIGNIKPKPEDFDLNMLLNENKELVSILAAQKNIDIFFEGKPNCTAYADQIMINTIIRNLLSNAVKFTPSNGIIRLGIAQENKNHKVYVADNGYGIPAEQLSTLFELKTDKESRPKSKDRGVGLGLILCKEFSTLNGGQIGVESQHGQGSTFWFTVPVSELSIEIPKESLAI